VRTFRPSFPLALVFGALLIRAIPASELSPAAVTFAPGYDATVTNQYGARELSVLRSQVAHTVSQSLASVGSRCNRPLNVTIERVAPTHPTIKQQLDNPWLDPTRTMYRNSGAALAGQVLDSSGRVLTTVKYDYFGGYQLPLSPATDAWSEARVAIDGFSRRLVDACVKHSS